MCDKQEGSALTALLNLKSYRLASCRVLMVGWRLNLKGTIDRAFPTHCKVLSGKPVGSCTCGSSSSCTVQYFLKKSLLMLRGFLLRWTQQQPNEKKEHISRSSSYRSI